MKPGEFIKQFVKSQAELADALGVSRTHVCDLLKGNRHLNPDMANRIARALKLNRFEHETLHRLGAKADGWMV